MIFGKIAPKEATFEQLEAAAAKSVFQCKDPCHDHIYPVQVAYSVEYRKHHVAVVVDGDCYSVQIDRNPRKMLEDVSRAQALAYIERMTNKKSVPG